MEHFGAKNPSATLNAVWFMDGLCFGVAYLLTGSLWLPTVWHAAHNLGIWSLGHFVVQINRGWISPDYGHSAAWVTTVYGLTSALITLAALGIYFRAGPRAIPLDLIKGRLPAPDTNGSRS